MPKIPVFNQSKQVIAVVTIDVVDRPLVEGASLNLTPDGYVFVRKNGERRLIHRWIMGLAFGDPREVDHMNGNRLDNRRSNLRICTHQENRQNRLPNKTYAGKPVTSRHRGVSWNAARGKWLVQQQVNGERKFLGWFDDELEAARVAEQFRREHMTFSVH